jgi:hypothetical protein
MRKNKLSNNLKRKIIKNKNNFNNKLNHINITIYLYYFLFLLYRYYVLLFNHFKYPLLFTKLNDVSKCSCAIL